MTASRVLWSPAVSAPRGVEEPGPPAAG